MRKLLVLLFIFASLGFNANTAKADTIQFRLHVTSSSYSAYTSAVKKTDWDPAVANIQGGLGLGKSVNIRVRTNAEGEAATYLYTANDNGRYTMHYLSGYGTVGRFYRLYASKAGPFNATITGRFAP